MVHFCQTRVKTCWLKEIIGSQNAAQADNNSIFIVGDI